MIGLRIRDTERNTHAKNSGIRAPTGFREVVPKEFHDFGDIFSKESFDTLPDFKKWDHPIELTPGSDPKFCKIYPLSPKEQVELDAFLEENLNSGRIRLSK